MCEERCWPFFSIVISVDNYVQDAVWRIRRYHFDTDPGQEKNRFGSGSRPNFDTDPDPGKNDMDPGKKEFSIRKI